jgi:hypothetical protein
VEGLAEAISAAMPALDVTGQQIAVAIYRLMGDGEPEAFEVGRALTERIAPELLGADAVRPAEADREEAAR